MGWKITFNGTPRELTAEEMLDPFAQHWDGGKVVDLDELSPDLYDGIALDEDGTDSWWGVYRFPCASGGRMFLIARAAAEFAGIPAPSKPANMREAEALMRCFERTEDISEKPVVDGFPPEPPETEVGLSSGQSDDSGGSPPKSDESPSEIS